MRLRVIALAFVLLPCLSLPAMAIKPWHIVFIETYVDGHENETFVEQATNKRFGCLVCHQGKKKKNHNPYGELLEDRLDKKEDKKNKEKVVAALREIESMHSDPDDESSPTFGELIAAGKLPGGALEEVKKEPAAEEEE